LNGFAFYFVTAGELLSRWDIFLIAASTQPPSAAPGVFVQELHETQAQDHGQQLRHRPAYRARLRRFLLLCHAGTTSHDKPRLTGMVRSAQGRGSACKLQPGYAAKAQTYATTLGVKIGTGCPGVSPEASHPQRLLLPLRGQADRIPQRISSIYSHVTTEVLGQNLATGNSSPRDHRLLLLGGGNSWRESWIISPPGYHTIPRPTRPMSSTCPGDLPAETSAARTAPDQSPGHQRRGNLCSLSNWQKENLPTEPEERPQKRQLNCIPRLR